MPPFNRFPVLVLAACLLALPCAKADPSIVEISEKSPQAVEKVQSLLTIGTSAAHPDVVLGNKQALIAAELRKLLKSNGVQVYAMAIKPGEPDSAKVIAESIAKYSVSHTLNLSIPNGTVMVKRSTGETISAKAYEVKTQLTDAKSGAVIWTHTAQVDSGFLFGASNAAVAQAIADRMRLDDLL